MKKFILKSLLLLPIGMVVVSINLMINPAHLTSSKDGFAYERGIAQLLLNGNNVINIDNFDARLVEKFYVQGLNESRDVIAIGSSRSMAINQDIFKGKTFFNHSVPGATLEDFLSIYYLYYSNGFKPKAVVLGVDPGVFNKNNHQALWRSLEVEYAQMRKVVGKASLKVDYKINEWVAPRYMELISLSYFQQSWRRWRDQKGLIVGKKHEKSQYMAVDSCFNEGPTYCSDGSRISDRLTREMPIEQVYSKASSFSSSENKFGLESYAVDREKMALFSDFIAWLRGQDVRVVVFLGPYHPATYKLLTETLPFGIINDVEKQLREAADKTGAQVVGSYNPHNLPVDEHDFQDGAHLKVSAPKKIFFPAYQ